MKATITYLSTVVFAAALFIAGSPVSAQGELSVELSANPSSWQAPLNDVDLTVQASGSAAQTADELTYKFDCTNDGVFERVDVTSAVTYIAFNVCDYPNPGSYTASVQASALGFTASDTVLISVGPVPTPPPAPAATLFVDLSANPSSGTAPLNDVDLTAQVSGSATGSISYRFDCRNDGSYELTIDNDTTTFIAFNLCDYAAAGTYTARVLVMRGGLTTQDTATITVNAAQSLVTTPTLSVTLTAIPSSGAAPLNDVDMKADVSGSATGTIDYRFDCTNNGPYEFETIVSQTTFTKADLCDYPSAGTYTARVFARRGGITAQDTAVIIVSQPSVSPPPPSPSPTPTLSVILTPFPSSGEAPLNDVDMAAEVSGTATGAITYRFDCTNDGKFESEDIITNITFTKVDLCDYPGVGLYTPLVWVARGGVSAQDTAFVAVNPAPTPPPPSPSPTPTPTPSPSPGPGVTLDVNLFADPNTGVAPLKGVDLNASVGGSAAGDITYKFDCTSDGTMELIVTSGHSVFNARDLCSFPSIGTYTAAVDVMRSGLSARSTAQVTVTPAAFALNIAALGRNKTEGETSWNDPVFAKPLHMVEFQIFVTSEGTKKLFGVSLKGTLPAKLTYKGNVRVDGASSSGNLLSGLALGDFEPGQTKTILFEAEAVDETQFALGVEDLVASFVASNPEETAADTVTVQVVKGGVLGATNVPTGLLSSMTLALVPTIVILLLVLLSYFFLFYVRNRNLLFAFKSRAEVELAHAVAKIRRRERI